jgi:hypothetical protein
MNPIESVTFSGFVSGGLAITNAVNVDFIDPFFFSKTSEVPTFFGVGQRLTAEEDTLGGFQINMQLIDPKASIITQLVARGTNDYLVTADWAYLNYRFNDNFAVRVGRVVEPIMMFSDYINVRYAFPWFRAPNEIYNTVTTQDFNGIIFDVSKLFFNNWLLEITTALGSESLISAQANGGINYEAQLNGGTEIRISNEFLTLRGFYGLPTISTTSLGSSLAIPQSLIGSPCITYAAYLDIRNPSTPLGGECDIYLTSDPAGLLLSAGVTGDPELAADFDISNSIIEYASLGYMFNWNNILSIGEYLTYHARNAILIPDVQNWYVSLGYRVHEVLVMFTYAQARTTNRSIREIDSPQLDWVNPFGQLATGGFLVNGLPIGPTMNDSVNKFFELFNPAQNSYSFDVRWDPVDSIAIKGQIQFIDPKDKIGISYFNLPPGKIVAQYGIGVDAVF